MIEIDLEDFEEFYNKKINSIFSKVKRASKKIIMGIKDSSIEIKVCLDHFIEAGEEKIDQKAKKSLKFFSDRIRKEIDEVDVPEEKISYDNIMGLLNSIKKLFTNINDIAKKSLPKIQKDFQPQIKELNYITRKLGKKQVVLEEFLRKKYTELKNAEYLLKRLPKIFILKDNVENSKSDLGQFEKELENRNITEEELNKKLVELEKDKIFNDHNRKNKDYIRYLSALKSEREELQTSVEEILNEKVKINITFEF